MNEHRHVVRRAPLVWWAGGLLLAMTQILAVSVQKPLGVSTQFAVLDGMALHEAAPDYAESHPLIGDEKYQKLGYGFWLDVGLVVGALSAAVAVRRWRPAITTVWWEANRGHSPGLRLLAGLIGGFLILLGARLAHGCTSGQFASGWAQLSLSVLPFTVGLFGLGMLTARLVYPKTPTIE